LLLTCSLMAFIAPRVRAHAMFSQEGSTTELKLGQAIERELKGGEMHAYRMTLTPGQYTKVVVDQKGIDVVLNLLDSEGRKLTEVDNPGRSEAAFTVAEIAGEFRLEVRAAEKEVKAGAYEILLKELRPATDHDRAAVAAQRLFEDGNRLRDQRTAESRRKAVQKYEEALPLWRGAGEKAGEAHTLDALGVTYNNLDEPKKAVECYSQALPLWRAVGDRISEATTLTNMGTAYWRAGEPQNALDLHGRALPLAVAAGDLQIEGLVLGNTGAVYWSLGQPQEALKHFDKALSIAQVRGDRRLQAITLNNIAAAHQQLGDLQKASESLTQAIALRRALGDGPGQAAALNNLGLLYTQLGDYQKALEFYNQALEIRRAAGERRWEATVLQGISVVQLRLGELGPALKSAEQALALARAVEDRRLEAYVLVVIGKIKQLLGGKKEALDNFERARSLRRAVEDRYGEIYTLISLGDGYLELGDQLKAADHSGQALKLSRDIGDRLGEAAALYGLARASGQAGDNASARGQIEEALALVESTRTKVASLDFRSSFFASYQGYYEFAVDLLMRMHEDDPSADYSVKALQWNERARARGLLEILAEARVDVREGVDAELLERERSLQQRLNDRAEKLTRLQSGKSTEAQLAAAQGEVKAVLAEYKDVETQIRAKSPGYAALIRPQPLSLKEIQGFLDSETLLLEYALGEDRSYLWVVSPTSIESFTLPKRSEIESQARRVYGTLTARNETLRFEKQEQKSARVALADAEYLEAATVLSRTVLGSAGKLLGKKRLLIVSDGALQYVPFGALPIPGSDALSVMNRKRRAGAYRPLAVEHEIATLPSASTLAVLREERLRRQRGSRALAVLADPVFGPDDPRVKRQPSGVSQQADGSGGGADVVPALDAYLVRSAGDFAKKEFQRLPNTRIEADAISAFVPQGEKRELLDFQADRRAAMSAEMGDYRIIHLATHGLLNSEHPELSGIVLSLVDKEGRPQNGFLRLNEIYNLRLGADLVVISACQTALGKEVRGEGLIGLTRGFMYAGAPRVVASLWAVDDEATVELMKNFYREMLTRSQRPAAALRAAQVAIWKRKRLPPYYWAAFVLQGDWR
jgi:CHAT domain-containing protein/Tfp pilus assembly protein PilF